MMLLGIYEKKTNAICKNPYGNVSAEGLLC